MSRLKFATLAVVAAASTFAISPANATVYVGYERQQDTSITQCGASGSSGAVSCTATPGAFSFTITGTGSPSVAQPDLFSTATTIRMASAANANSASVYVSETNITTIPTTFDVAYTENGNSTIDWTESVYVSQANTKFGTDTLIGSDTLSPGSALDVDYSVPASLTGPYSVTLVYTGTFPGGMNSEAEGSLSEVNVPEPMSLSLLGFGLLGLAVYRLRRRSWRV